MRKLLYVPMLFFLVAGVGAIELAGVMAMAHQTLDARLAVLQAEQAVANLAILAHPGDPSITIEPSYRRIADDLSGSSRNDAFALSFSAAIPLGISAVAADKLALARLQASHSAALVAQVSDQAILRAYALYAAAWMAQEDARFATRERDLVEAEFAATRSRFEAGLIAYGDIRKAEEALLAARDTATAAEMRRRISRLELFSWLNIADDTKPLIMTKPAPRELPKAPDLAAHALFNDPSLKDAQARDALVRDQLDQASKLSLPLSIRVGVSKDDHSGSISFATETRKLSAYYTLPIIDLTGATVTRPWTITASVALSLDTGRAESLASAAQRLATDIDRLKLDAAISKLSLDTRLAFQAWSRAVDSQEQAERMATLSVELRDIVRARVAAGSATALELTRAELDTERSAYLAVQRAVEAERLRMQAAFTARYNLNGQGD
jgi:outer membrane protein TolC